MKIPESLLIQQLEDSLAPFRILLSAPRPRGWIRAIRESLGMTNVQLARRVGRKPQTVLDLQERESAGTIQLSSLRELAQALDCELVYAIVPRKPLGRMLRERAEAVARETIGRTGYSMALEQQELGVRESGRAMAREIERLLAGSRRRLWE